MNTFSSWQTKLPPSDLSLFMIILLEATVSKMRESSKKQMLSTTKLGKNIDEPGPKLIAVNSGESSGKENFGDTDDSVKSSRLEHSRKKSARTCKLVSESHPPSTTC